MTTTRDKLELEADKAWEEWEVAERWWLESGGIYTASVAEENAWNNYLRAVNKLNTFIGEQNAKHQVRITENG